MLDQQTRTVPAAARPDAPPARGDGAIGLREVIGFVRRRRLSILAGVVVGLALGLAYVLTASPLYKASAALLIDTRKMEIFGTGNVFEDASINTAAIESQVQVLLSGRIAEAVVRRLDLTSDAEFMNPPQGRLSAITGLFSGLFAAEPQPPADPEAAAERQMRRAAAIIAKNLDVDRVGLSYVLSIGYVSTDPAEAARIANGVAGAYLEDIVAAASEQTKRTTAWLESRVTELRAQAEAPGLSPQEKAAVRATYDNLVARYTQMLQQQSVPFTEARLITVAQPPTSTTGLKSSLVLAAALVFGVVLGLGLALARELLDRSLTTAAQLEALSGLPCLGLLPAFSARGFRARLRERRAKAKRDAGGRRFQPGAAQSMALTAPSSRYAETLRNIRLAAETTLQEGPVQVLGVISAIPNEGRTTTAVNFARLVAQSGVRVLLVDADLRNPALSAALVGPGAPGLIQAAAGEAAIDEAIWSDDQTALKFLPAGAPPNFFDGGAVLASERMVGLMNQIRPRFDLIVVDLPPVTPVIDVRAASHLFDGFVFVVEWGRTDEDIVREALWGGGLDAKIVGTVLNKVALGRIGRYQPSAMVRWRNKYIKSYGYIG